MTVSGRRILANTGYRAIAELGSKVATFVLFVLMARKLGESDFGVFTFALSLTLVTSVLGDFGQIQVLVREVARNREAVHDHFGNNVVMRLGLALAGLGITLGVLAAFGSTSKTLLVVLLVGLSNAFELLRGALFGVMEAYERLGFEPIVLVTQRFIGTIAAAIVLFTGGGVVFVAAVYMLGSASGVLLSTFFVFTRIVVPRFHVSLRDWWPLMRMAIPIGIAGVFGTVLFRADAALLAAFKSNEIVGDYGAAYRIFESTLFIGWAIGAALYPIYSRLSRTSEPTVRAISEWSFKLAAAATVPLTVAGVVLARPLIFLLYGRAYEQSVAAVKLLAPAVSLYAVAFLCGLVLVAQGRPKPMTVVLGLGAVENIVANLLMIPHLSLKATALNTSLSQFLVTVPLLVLVARTVGGFSYLRTFSGPVVAGLVSAGAMAVLRDSPLVALGAGLLAYAVVLGVVEWFAFPEDAQLVRAMFRRELSA
jgi:O-antigen/teichoic acid export membrane protein